MRRFGIAAVSTASFMRRYGIAAVTVALRWFGIVVIATFGSPLRRLRWRFGFVTVTVACGDYSGMRRFGLVV